MCIKKMKKIKQTKKHNQTITKNGIPSNSPRVVSPKQYDKKTKTKPNIIMVVWYQEKTKQKENMV